MCATRASDTYAPKDEQPTGIRWQILALLMAQACFVHFNRISMAVAGTEKLMGEFSLSETQMGTVYSSYLFLYTLCMIPGGWLIDRIGPKRAMMLMAFGSAILVPVTGLAKHASAGSILLVLCLIRATLGIVTTPMHPGAARMVSFWFPPRMRGAANGLVTAGAVAGIAITYVVFGWLMDRFGWPGAFLAAGVATLILSVVWTAYVTDHPHQHRLANRAEVDLIEGPAANSPATESAVVPASTPVGMPPEGTRSLLMLTLSYAAYSYFQYLAFYWTEYYFKEILELSTEVSRYYSTLVSVSMAVGMFAGGWLGDYVAQTSRSPRARAYTPIAGLLASALLLLNGFAVSDPQWFVWSFILSMGALGMCESAYWVTGIELGRHRGGTSGGFLNAGGNAGGILAPIVTPTFAEYFGWNAAMCLACVFSVIGAILWLGVQFPRLSKEGAAG